MKNIDVKKIRKAMERAQDDNRFQHTLGVAYTATALAMRYGEDILNAELAGYLHDCAKTFDDDKLLSMCEKYNISISETERQKPFLLHAKVGSFVAMNTYHVQNSDVINAILNHTTGRPGMSQLEKIIFVADYIEPSRKNRPGLDEVRKIAFTDLDEAFIKILEQLLGYLNSIGDVIDPITQKTYEYYKK